MAQGPVSCSVPTAHAWRGRCWRGAVLARGAERGAAVPRALPRRPDRAWWHRLASAMTMAADMRWPQCGLNSGAAQPSYSVRSVVRLDRAWSARAAPRLKPPNVLWMRSRQPLPPPPLARCLCHGRHRRLFRCRLPRRVCRLPESLGPSVRLQVRPLRPRLCVLSRSRRAAFPRLLRCPRRRWRLRLLRLHRSEELV